MDCFVASLLAMTVFDPTPLAMTVSTPPVSRLLSSRHRPRKRAIQYSEALALRRDNEGCLHVGMEAAVIFDRAGLVQNRGDGFVRRHGHVPVAVSRRRGMRKN